MEFDSSKLIIREAGIDDLDEIHAIECASFLTPWSRSLLIDDIKQLLSYYCVAVYDGTICGYAGIWLILDEAHVSNVAVMPEYRGLGIGKAIMQHLMKYSRTRKLCAMTLEVREKNTVAQSLYTSLGFAVGGRRKKYYPDTNEDALIMWVEL